MHMKGWAGLGCMGSEWRLGFYINVTRLKIDDLFLYYYHWF